MRMLERLGYRADVAANGLEVLRALRSYPYDVVLMDVQMPEMDGLEETRNIRRIPGSQPRIIAMTAHAMKGDREECLGAGHERLCLQTGANRRAVRRSAAQPSVGPRQKAQLNSYAWKNIVSLRGYAAIRAK